MGDYGLSGAEGGVQVRALRPASGIQIFHTVTSASLTKSDLPRVEPSATACRLAPPWGAGYSLQVALQKK